MSVQFPAECRLSESEQSLLDDILSDVDNPCSGCAWQSTCGGYEGQRRMADELAKSPEDRCLVCGGDAVGRVTSSKLIAGSFHYCDVSDDEYMFVPLEAPVTDSSAEAIEF